MLAVMLRIFGTTTSPYVRRVRVVALELGLSFEWMDTASEAGQAELRALSPVWKVPVVELEEEPIFDSRVITEHLVRRHPSGPIAAVDESDLHARNVITVIDGALDSLINALYLQRDGLGSAQSAYVAKQHERAGASLAWLEARVDDVWLTKARAFGLAELALVTALEWMRFREMYPVGRHEGLVRCLEHHGARESLRATRPQA
jgi:glutathione S-transferase